MDHALAQLPIALYLLGQPWIIAIAGILYGLEFFADKVPWLDSAWDTVHTIIRPIGGALLAIQVLGHHSPMMDVLIVLLGGSASLVTHSAKASTRLIANASPELVNIGLSVAEDVVVFGGLALIHVPSSRFPSSPSRSPRSSTSLQKFFVPRKRRSGSR